MRLDLTHIQRWIQPGSRVLDLGCGWGEFIRNVQASRKYAMDLNPWVINENPMIVEFEPDEIAGFDGVTVTFPWAKGMTDVSYVIQISSD